MHLILIYSSHLCTSGDVNQYTYINCALRGSPWSFSTERINELSGREERGNQRRESEFILERGEKEREEREEEKFGRGGGRATWAC